MRPHARKINWTAWIIILAILMVMAYYMSALFILPGVRLDTISDEYLYAITHPWPPLKYVNEYTKSCLLGMFMVWVIAFSNYLSKNKNYMFGKEHGTADWADIRKFNKEMADWITVRGRKQFSSNNRILSQNARISYDSTKTDVNNNQLVVGGSGSRKTTSIISPNLLQFHGSNIYTDPKGSLLKLFGHTLEKEGIVVKSINLCDMRQSIQYNPFEYIRTQNDLDKLITNIMDNTTPKESVSKDPFWEAAEAMYLKAVFNYVWLECPREEIIEREDEYGVSHERIRLERSFRTVLHLLDEAGVPAAKGAVSPLTMRMEQLKKESPRHEMHPAYKNYNRCIQSAGDTMRSIIICANSRFSKFDNEEVLRILDRDETDLTSIGIGKDGDGKTRTAFFCIIPDEDKTYNAIIGMFYTQLIQELYRLARTYEDDRLPLDVGFWLDEFRNIKMPDNFKEFLSGCRSRGIYCTIVMQSLTQLKELYKEGWETISGDCNTFIYLGGFENFTHEYLSKELGDMTIAKRSSSETKGNHGSSSTNEDVIGRALMRPDEIGRMRRRDCIVRVYGQQPIYDRKYNLFLTKEFLRARALGRYIFEPKIIMNEETGVLTTIRPETAFRTLDADSLEYYRQSEQRGENVKVITLTEDELDAMDFDSHEEDPEVIRKMLEENDKKHQKEKTDSGSGMGKKNNQEGQGDPSKADDTSAEGKYMGEKNISTEEYSLQEEAGSYMEYDSLMDMLVSNEYTDDQIEEIRIGQEAGLEEHVIMQYADVRNSAEKMRILREMIGSET